MNRSLAELQKHKKYETLWPLMRCWHRSVQSCPQRNNIHHRYHPPHAMLQHKFRRRQNFIISALEVSTIQKKYRVRTFSASSELEVQAIQAHNLQPATRQSNYGYRDLLKWTENILHPIRTPIGSIHPSLWQDVFVAMQVWLGYKPSLTLEQLLEMISTSDDPSSAVMLAATEPLTPRHVDLVDRLLSRLLYEHSAYRYNGSVPTHRRRTFQEHDQQLQLWTTILCQSWLTISKTYSNSPMAIQKASMWYDKMNESIWLSLPQQMDDGSFMQQQQQKAPFVVALIQAHQRLVDTPSLKLIRSQACQMAVNLLLDESTVHVIIPHCTNTPHADNLKSCYQLALQQTLELVAADNATMGDNHDGNNNRMIAATTTIKNSSHVDLVSTASLILEQVIELSELPGWSDIRFQDGELDKVFDALFLNRMKDDIVQPEKVKKKLSSFERGTLQQRILTKINQAMTIKDQETVEELVLYWRSHMQGDDEGKDSLLWKPFAQAVTNYYLRVQDPVKATKWMQIQEQMPSQEAILQAIQSTTTRPSLVMTDDNTSVDTNAGSTFEELIALNRVFAENEEERIKQKLNLLDIWVTKVRSPSVPWRATEILESLESETNSAKMLTPATYAKVVKLWLHRSSDSIAGQKALDIAMRCPKFDMSLLISISNLLVKRQAAGDTIAPQNACAIVDLIREKFDEIPTDQIESMISNAFKLLHTMPQSLEFLKFILEKGVDITSEIMNEAVHSYQPNVASLLALLDLDTESALELSSEFRKAAIHHLLSKTPITPQTADRVTVLLCDVTMDMCDDNKAIHDILDLNFEALKLLATVQYEAFAQRIMFNLEKAIYTKDDPLVSPLYDAVNNTKDASTEMKSPFFAPDQDIDPVKSQEDEVESDKAATDDMASEEETLPEKLSRKALMEPKISPIPMSFYKRLIILFGEKNNANMIEHVYSRLREHRANGYVELHPDQSCCAVYLKVVREAHGLYSLDSRIDMLLRLIGRYESSDQEDENFKPQYIWFDVLIGDLHERLKLMKATPEQALTVNAKQDDPYEKDSRAAVKLLHKMHLLHIVPNNVGRVFPFNATMEMVMAGKNQRVHYKIITTLKKQMDELGLEANSYTMSILLKSCERAEPSQSFAALTTMLQCLTDLRQMGKVHPAVYNQCFKIFQLKRTLSDREFVIAEKMMATVFKCCIDDGMLINPVRYHFKALTLPMTYKRNYFDLLEDGCEPASWVRNSEYKLT